MSLVARTDLETGPDSKKFPTYGYSNLIEQIFALIEDDSTFQAIKSRLKQALM